MNYAELFHMTRILSLDCHAARVDNIIDGPNTVCMSLTRYVDTGDAPSKRHIVFDLGRGHLDFYPLERPPKAPQTPQAFTMLLRKHLNSQRISAIRMSSCDRIVTLEFGPDTAPRNALVAEFTGCHPNIFLLELPSGIILGSIWRDENRETHTTYNPPASPNRIENQTDRFADVPDSEYIKICSQFFLARNRDEKLRDAKTNLEKRLNGAINKLSKKRNAFVQDIEKAESSVKDRTEADLLSAYAWQIQRGARSVSLPDFETGEPVCISLSPELSVRENIDVRYRRYKRLTRALPQTRARLEEIDSQIGRLKTALSELTQTESIETVLALEEKHKSLLEKSLPKLQNPPKSKDPVELHKPYKMFTSACGIPIFVGKSASDNDFLTFRVARGNDWWLHAAHVPGSHVIIKSPKPDSETILDAATLAVHYSRLANAETADVQLTQQKNVHRAKDAPAGKVDLRGEKILHVTVEENRIKRLLDTEK